MSNFIFLLAALFTVTFAAPSPNATLRFPDDFIFGVSTAAYQIEGAWNEDGKGEHIWDRLLHEHPEWTLDGQNGDIADDSYHKYKEDVQLIKEMNLDFYRFSISWARILPNGDLSEINKKGIDYYNNLIDELVANGIEPMVTMYHWDLPQKLQDLGGWANKEIAMYFLDYAEILFTTFGDRVKWWITFNEPGVFCAGYSGELAHAPALRNNGVGDYLCSTTLLLGHAYAYKLYNDKFRASQNGNVGISPSSHWFHPKTNSTADLDAAERDIQFFLGWFANPIFSSEGDYPQVMRERIAANSATEGRKRSRLPSFTSEEIKLLKGSADFLGINHYTTVYCEPGARGYLVPSRERDTGVRQSDDPSWPPSGSSWLKVVPWGFRRLLNWIHKTYNGPKIIVTENGFSDNDGRLDDQGRIDYYKQYLSELLKAIHEDGVNVIGYTAWSLLDNFEWTQGYTEKFGLFQIDYASPERTRTAKRSSKFFTEIAETHEIPEDF